jgi:hypothetical protein
MDLIESRAFSFIKTSRHPWEVARLGIITSLLKSIIKETKKSDPVIFDIGCGDVFLAKNISKSVPNSEIHAVDTAFDDEKIQEMRKLTASSNILLYDNIENIALSGSKKADFVLLLDVIEHIENDAEFLARLAKNKNVTRETNFLITVPAFQSLFSSHDKFLRHYRRYSRKSLVRKISLSCYESMESGYFFHVLLFPRILRLYLEKLKPVKSSEYGIGQWKHGRILTWIIIVFLRIDYFLGRMFKSIGITIPGLSVYSICKPFV